ncbi:MAG: translocation/assembly module TamB [Deltaproteobacteria bacterium]|jgi:hypothetical protein|nr:translocation/assembly module TamB [Deltaproteobacteria bacterium]
MGKTFNLNKSPQSRKKRPLKKAARFLFLTVLTLTATLAAAVLVLRTDWGLSWVAAKAASFLTELGLEAHWEKIEGPVPEKLTLTGLTLADRNGKFLSVRQANLELSTLAIFKGKLDITALEVTGLDWLRRPELPSVPPTEDRSGSYLGLSAKLSIVDSRIAPLVFLPSAPADLSDSAAGPKNFPGPLPCPGPAANLAEAPSSPLTPQDGSPDSESTAQSLAATGISVPLMSPECDSGERGRFKFLAALEYGADGFFFDFDGQWEDYRRFSQAQGPTPGLTAKGSLTQGAAGTPDELAISITAHDGPGGTLSNLLGQPSLPTWTFSMSGQGPLTDWTGLASLGLDDNLEGSGLATARFNLALPEGSIKQALTENRQARLALEIDGGPKIPLPEVALVKLGRGLVLKTDLFLKGQNISGSLNLITPNARLSLKSIETTRQGDNWQLSASGSAAFEPSLVASLAAKEAAASQNAVRPDSSLSSEPNSAPALDSALTPAALETPPPPAVSISPNRPPDLSGPLYGPQASFIAADYQLNMSGQGSAVKVDSLDLTGAGLVISSEGTLDSDGTIQTRLVMDIDHSSPWLDLITGASPGSTPAAVSVKSRFRKAADGKLSLSTDFQTSNIGLFLPAWQGELKGNFSAAGPLEDLETVINLTSPAMSAPSGQAFSDFQASLNFRILDLTTKFFAEGLISAGLKDKTASQFEASSTVKLEIGPPFKASVSELKIIADRGKRLELLSPSLNLLQGSPPQVEGQVSLTVNDWQTVADLTGLAISGDPAHLEASIGRHEQTGEPLAAAQLSLPKFNLNDLALSEVTLDLKAQNFRLQPDLELNLAMGAGRAGEISFSSGLIKASSQDGTGNFSFDLKSPTGGELVYLSGELNLASSQILLSTFLAAPPQLPDKITLLKPALITLRPAGVKDLNLAYGQGATLTADFSTAPAKALVKINNFPLSAFSNLSDQVPPGQVNLEADYTQGGSGRFELKASIATPASVEGLPKVLDLIASGNLTASGRELTGTIGLVPSQSRKVELNYRLPMKAAGSWVMPDQNGTIQANLAWKGQITPLWSLAGQADRRLTGLLDLDLVLSGPLKKPEPKLKAYLINGAYDDLINGFFLSGINAELTSAADHCLKLIVEASDSRGGRMALAGDIFPFDPSPTINLRGQLIALSPLQRDDADLTITALTSVEGPLAAPAISVNAVINTADINLDNARSSRSIKTLPIGTEEESTSGGSSININIDLPRQVFIRGRGLDSEWAGSLKVAGPAGRTLISGYLKPVRGTFTLLSKQFILSDGDIQFLNTSRLNPILNLELTRQTTELTAIVKVTGTVSSPHLDLQSQPPHPSDEVLSQVLFGKKVSQLSRVEALQLANSLRVMAGLGGDIGLTVLNNLRDTLGLSVLRIGDGSGASSSRYLSGNNFRENFGLDSDANPEAESAATIEAGRYLSENVYVGLEQNLGDNSTGVRVEVELTPSLTLKGVTTSNSSRVGLGWKKDY